MATAPQNPAPPMVAVPKDPVDAALTLERMAFDLLFLRRFLMDRNLYGQLPACRSSLADAAQALQEFATVHLLRAKLAADEKKESE